MSHRMLPFVTLMTVMALGTAGCMAESDELDEDVEQEEETATAEQAVLGSFNLFPFAGGSSPKDVTIYGSFVYWTKGSEIWKTSKTPNGGSSLLCSDCGDPYEIGVDGSYVFYADAVNGIIASVSVAGGGLPLFIASSPLPIIIEGNVVVDNDFVYWPTSTAIYKAPKFGGTPIAIVAGINPVAIAQDSSSIYFTGNGLVRKVSKSSGVVSTIATGSALNLVVTGGFVVWNELGGAIRRVSSVGGTVTTFNTVVSGRSNTSVGADGTFIFYTDRPSSGVGTSYVRRATIALPSTAGAAIYSLNASLMPDDVSSDGSYIYWGDGNGIKKAERQ
jgi:hypothetical protein